MLDVKRNLTTMTDFYELTMSAGYLDEGYVDKIAVFDMFFRRVPDGGGYAVMAGLQQFIDAVDHLEFTDEDIEYLRSTKAFDEKFLTYLANFKLHCNIWAIEEGMPIFPQEPIVTVEGPAIECQLLETLLLVTFNHQCLIATKANRIVRSAAGRPVMEFGARRAQGYDAAYFGARASYIGGCGSTSCVMAARDFGIPASGTMAHSWVQMFPTEYDAFKKYAEMYPDACVLLVDTYNVLRHGVPDAIKVFDEVLKPMGKRPKGIRIDSGDIAYLSKKARKMLDEAGWKKNKDGLLERDGKPFLFTILVNQGNDSRIKAAIIIQSQLKALGITVHIRTVEWAAFIKEFVNKGHFDAIILAWTITLDPDIYDVWHSSRAKPGGLNFTGYRNAEVDELLVEARSMTDQDRRKELYDRVQEILDAEQPYCFLYVPYALPIVQARFQGIKPALNGIMYNFDRWWVPKDLQRYHVRP